MNSGQASKTRSAPLLTVRGEGYLLNMFIYLSMTLSGGRGHSICLPLSDTVMPSMG